MHELEIRRDNLFNKMKENSVAILFAGKEKICSEDEFYPFEVNRNFFYLTNIEQDNSILLLIKGIGVKKTYLFVDQYDEKKEKWTGKRLTSEEAYEIAHIQNVYFTDAFENMLSLALTKVNNQYGNIDTLYLDLSPELKIKDEYSTHNLKDFIESEYPHIEVKNVYPFLRDLRMVKSRYEIEQMQEAINLTSSGIAQMIYNLRPGVYEYNLADDFEFYGRTNGRHKLAFSTIVASGKNATCLHYPTQNDTVKHKELILFDLGYRHNGYCADISRTYPVDGVYEGTQKEIYEAVLACNKFIINYVRSGMTIKDLQEKAKEILKTECVKRKLMKEDEDIIKYYFHNVSHHLGIDTHDISDREKPLENGNVITVEPGLYFSDLGIGVRIEDDVLIKDDIGYCLSSGIAKEISDIEKIFKTKR